MESTVAAAVCGGARRRATGGGRAGVVGLLGLVEAVVGLLWRRVFFSFYYLLEHVCILICVACINVYK